MKTCVLKTHVASVKTCVVKTHVFENMCYIENVCYCYNENMCCENVCSNSENVCCENVCCHDEMKTHSQFTKLCTTLPLKHDWL